MHSTHPLGSRSSKWHSSVRALHFSHSFRTPGARPNPVALFTGARFLRNELCIRLAHRVLDLETLPYGLSSMHSVCRVKQWYEQSFDELLSANLKQSGRPDWIKTHKSYFDAPERHVTDVPDAAEAFRDNAAFVKSLSQIKRRHDPVMMTIGRGLLELKEGSMKGQYEVVDVKVQEFLDRFFLSRIGIRVLIGQHIALHAQCEKQLSKKWRATSSGDHQIGIIDTETRRARSAG